MGELMVVVKCASIRERFQVIDEILNLGGGAYGVSVPNTRRTKALWLVEDGLAGLVLEVSIQKS